MNVDDLEILNNTCRFYNELNKVWLREDVNKDVSSFIDSKINLPQQDNINPLDFIYARQYLIHKIYLSNGYDLDKINYLITNNLNNDPNIHDRIRDKVKINKIISLYKQITSKEKKLISQNKKLKQIYFYKLLFLSSKFDFRYSYLQTMFYSVAHYIEYPDASNSNIDFSKIDPSDPIVFTTNDVAIPPHNFLDLDLLEEMDFLITPQTKSSPSFLFLDAYLYTAKSEINFPEGFNMSPNHFLHVLNLYRYPVPEKITTEPTTLDELYTELMLIYLKNPPTNENLRELVDILIKINILQFNQKEPENIPPPTKTTTDIIQNQKITMYQVSHVIDIALFVYYYEYIDDIQMKESFDLYVKEMISNTKTFIQESSSSSLFKTMFF
jgi:hypothetical protein